mgnify:CR=1 FL=1
MRERHLDRGVVNDTVMLPAGGGRVLVVADGHDFFAAPRWSPDGNSRSWLSWDHPNMPWDGTELWLAEIDGNGQIGAARQVAGGAGEASSESRSRAIESVVNC